MKIEERNGTKTVQMLKPFNAHVHVRETHQLGYLVPLSARQFWCIVAMPNLAEPLDTVTAVVQYQNAAAFIGQVRDPSFCVIVPLYLTDDTTSDDIRAAHAAGIVVAKLYPSGATTRSHKGVSSLDRIWHIFEAMQDVDMVLSVHCEETDPEIDFFDRERYFVHTHLARIRVAFPELRMIFEHVSTKEGVDFVMEAGQCTGATITVQHLMCNRNDLFSQGLMPQLFCFPIVNTRRDQEAVANAVKHERFFLGTDSAPHPIDLKYHDHGRGGCFTEPYAMALYAEIFEKLGTLDLLEEFASLRGTRFYGMTPSTVLVILTKEESGIAAILPIGPQTTARPFLHGKKIQWRFMNADA